MADEKSATVIEPYERFEEPVKKQIVVLKPKTQKVLLGYAAAITAAFVVATILGGVYYANTVTILEAQNNNLVASLKEITVGSTNQKVAVDTANGVSVFYPQGPGVPNGTVAAIDYKRSVTGIYDPQTKECYVTAGLSTTVPGAIGLNDEVNSGNFDSTTNARTYYQKVDNIAVQDHSVLPSPLQSICVGLPVYWMEKAEAPSAGNTTATATASSVGRKKRDLAYACYSGTSVYYSSYYCCRAEVCIYIGSGRWYCYLYCYFCRKYGGVGSLVSYAYTC